MASSSQLRHFGALAQERDVTILGAAVDGTLKRNQEESTAAKTSTRELEDTGDASDGEDVLGLRAGTVKEEPEKDAVVEGGMEVDPVSGAPEREGEQVLEATRETAVEDAASNEATPTVHEDEERDDKVEEGVEEETTDVKAEQTEEVSDEKVEDAKPPRPATPESPVSQCDRAGINGSREG
jgi:hypothetical protein